VGAPATPSAITAACAPVSSPAANAAEVFGSTPERRVRAVRTVRAACPGVWWATARSQEPAVIAPSRE
jgi:hypothetical protein